MRGHTLISCVSLSFVLSLATACGDKKEFGAAVPEKKTTKETPKVDVKPTPTPKPTPEPASQPIPVKPVKPICDPGEVGVTQVNLLSTGILTKTAKQTIRYELQMLNCEDGSIIPIKDQIISFDLNAATSNGFQDINYAVLDAATNAPIADGILDVIEGSDLFGNFGTFAHWETKSLSYETKVEKLVLEIKLDNNKFSPREPGATQIDSYLKLGDTKAVTQPLTIND